MCEWECEDVSIRHCLMPCHSDSAITLDANDNYKCFEGKHIAFAVCAMLALVVYYPAASFAQAQTQSISDIKFKPKVVFIMLQVCLVQLTVLLFLSHALVCRASF